MDDNIIIKVDQLSKIFKLPHEKYSSIKSAVINFYKRNKGYEMQVALTNISFEVKKGEFFGIVGKNGSGKSTLLKLLAGIYFPTGGTIEVKAGLTPFIELGVGFNNELTGRENVYLNGALLGFNRKEMDRMYDDIVEFAELERFMDQKLKNFSSGMQVRLAFSIAIRAKNDILLLDEVLAVGDASFQKKCFDYFKQLKKDKQTVVLVSHDMSTIEKYCDRVMLLDNSEVMEIGDTREVAAKYRLLNLPKETKEENRKDGQLNSQVVIDEVTINGKKELSVSGNEDLIIEVKYTPKVTRNYIVSVSIFRNDGTHVAYYDNREASKKVKFPNDVQQVTNCKFSTNQLLNGAYSVDIEIYSNELFLANKTNAVKFAIMEKSLNKAGLVNLQGKWEIQKF
jgi:ABC-2 type transport system ATP-binding protein